MSKPADRDLHITIKEEEQIRHNHRYECPLCLQACNDEQGFINHLALRHGGVIADRRQSLARSQV